MTSMLFAGGLPGLQTIAALINSPVEFMLCSHPLYAVTKAGFCASKKEKKKTDGEKKVSDNLGGRLFHFETTCTVLVEIEHIKDRLMGVWKLPGDR